jgi:glucan phosphorylase
MSVNKERDVRQLVEKYRRQFPTLERPFIRRLIRSENKIENPSELKKLDRYLAKAFKNEARFPAQEKPLTERPIVRRLSPDQWQALMREVNLQTYLRLVAEFNPNAQALKEWADIRKQQQKDLGLVSFSEK